MAIDSPDRDASLHTPVDRHYAWSDLTFSDNSLWRGLSREAVGYRAIR